MLPDGELICVAFLTDAERELILAVLQRDEKLRRAEEQRVRRLKAELLDIKKKGAKSGSRTYSNRSCARCLEPLSPLGVGYCQGCNHQVCCKCRAVRSNGFWVCNVCAKEVDLKKSTGDWFYDQRVNRFLNSPGHNLVGASLRKRPPVKKRETVGEVLLQSSEVRHSQPIPFRQPRQKDPVDFNKGTIPEASDPPEPELEQRGNVGKGSLGSYRTASETSVAVDGLEAEATDWFSIASSQESIQTVLGKESHTYSSISDPTSILHRVNPCSEIIFFEEGLFKNSTSRAQLPAEYSTEVPGGSMGDRSKSVPGLSMQEEEEEDIDKLVKVHRMAAHRSDFSLHTSMSKSSLDSMTSMYSEAEDYTSVEISGDIVFSLGYDKPSRTLSVFIKECHNLTYGDTARQRSNPYVKCYLLPEKSRQSKKKTVIKRSTVSPIYNETLKFSISHSQLLMRTLLLSVWHSDLFGHNVFLGKAELPLDCRDLDSAHEECVALRGKVILHTKSFTPYKGQLVVSLKYVTTDKPSTDDARVPFSLGKKSGGGELHILVKEARDLTPRKAGGATDSFVKGYLLPAKTRATKRKTPVVRMTLNPHYDHTFVYKDLSLEELRGMCLELTVWDHEAVSSNDFLGGVQLNTGTAEWSASTEEVSLWQKMMQYPNSWAEGTLPLCSSMGPSK